VAGLFEGIGLAPDASGLEQGQHALLRLVGLGQHGGGGLRNDLRLGQVVIIPNSGCHPGLDPGSMQHVPLHEPARSWIAAQARNDKFS